MIPDWLLLIINWVHHLGAVTWVGGSIFYKFVLQPAFRTSDAEPATARAIGHEFGRVVPIAIAILAVTGAIMAVVHLTAGGNSTEYIGILAVKIALAVYLFLVVFLRRRSRAQESADRPVSGFARLRGALTSTTALLIVGIAIIGLADVLGAMGGHGAGGHGEAAPAEGHHESDDPSAGEEEAPDAGESDGNGDDHHNGDHH